MSAQVPGSLPGPVRHRCATGHGGVSLAVVEIGDPASPAWAIAHGAGSSARFVVAAFAGPVLRAGGRLVTYDLRGHGASDPARQPADHHLDVQVADLLAVTTGTSGPITALGGVSLGAHAAVRAVAAGSAPVVDVEVAVACLPAWTGPSVAGAGPHAANADEVRRLGIGAVIDRLRAADGLPAWLHDTLLADYPRHDPPSLAATLVALDGGEAPGEAELRGLTVPLAVTGWADDPGHPLDVAQRWAGLAPRGALAELRLGDLDTGVDALGHAAVAAVAAALAADLTVGGRSRAQLRHP